MKDNQSAKNNPEQDNRLAEFTDQLMSGKASPKPASDDNELEQLEITLQRLKTMVDSDQPKQEFRSLLDMRLQRAWEEQQRRSRQEKKRAILHLPDWLRQPSPGLQFATVAAVMVIAVLALLPGDLPLQGAAGGVISSLLPWIASVGLVGILIVLIWTYRKK